MNLEPNETKQVISPPISRASNFTKLILERILNYLKQCLRIEVFLMLIGGMMRHTAGFAWGYNQVIFFTDKFPEEENTKLYLMICPVIAGVSGATMGGFLSDFARKHPMLSGAKGGKYDFKIKINFMLK